jgi:hypothetical protein
MEPAEYFKIRLDHTIQHTQKATSLLYLIDGALLAMFYFVVEKLGSWPVERGIQAFILILLGLLNAVHGYFLLRQSVWYAILDQAFAQEVGRTSPTLREVEIAGPWTLRCIRFFVIKGPGGQQMISYIHLLVAIIAIGAAIFIGINGAVSNGVGPPT